ncbi:MAG: hypothetical protein AAB036_05925, partial [Elusimicrobiota bacterium]
MSVVLTPISPRYTVSDADDPYKKYWWAILLGFAGTTVWLLSPMLGERPIGSTRVGAAATAPGADVEQSLSSAQGTAGAEASLAAQSSAKSAEAQGGSSLYQGAPGDSAGSDQTAAATDAPGAAAAEKSLADELKKVSEGGWGEKPRRGFSAPKLSGGAMSGLSSAVGGRAQSASSVGAFGVRNAQVGVSAAPSISETRESAASGAKGLASLKSVAVSARLAAGTASGDAAANSLNRAFDGANVENRIGGPGGAPIGSAYEA